MDHDRLTELKRHSVHIGSNPNLVQSSGGNTSWKNGKEIWVKSSGKRLKDAHRENIFSKIGFGTLGQNQIIQCEDFSDYLLDGVSPSIEANFHILIENDFVTHLHSLGAIALGVSDIALRLNIPEMGICFIPYHRPGVDLAKAILETKNFQENILILQNHGVIFSKPTSSKIETEIEWFESTVKKLFGDVEQYQHFPNWIEILVSGVLTPDEAVFLGRKPFIESETSVEQSVSINSAGQLLFPEGFSPDRIEMAQFYVRVAKLIEKRTSVSYLPIEEVDSLLGWDKEKIRIAMAK
jgi:rhamnose utilization protein RhaD (predicted bifunctional aldolase and dehydrogenase)